MLGFKSESLVVELLQGLASFADGEEEWLEWPVSVMGKITGRREDVLAFMFLPKSSWDPKKFRNRLQKVAAGQVPKNLGTDQDIMPVTHYYRRAMMGLIAQILKRGNEYTNNPESETRPGP
jgi:hypothetical protein